ncbi:MAG: hypothetical protein VX265_13920 [Myxococcota bacterium]|nr:hypothetical protein [Myxococcota bacterium]
MTWTLPRLVRHMLSRCKVVILRNPYGTTELRGDDLAIKEHGDWVTVYHRSAATSESRSHLHLRHRTLSYAAIREREGMTPVLGFWPDAASVREDQKPPLTMTFPSFYNWAGDKEPIPEHHAFFRSWVEAYGSRFQLEPERPSEDPFQRYFWGYAFGKGRRSDEQVQIVTTDAAVGAMFLEGWDAAIQETRKRRPRFNIHRPHLSPRGEVEEHILTLRGRDLPDPAALSTIVSVSGSDSAEFWRGVTDVCGILCFRKKKRRLGLAFSHPEPRRMRDLHKTLRQRGWNVSEIQLSKAGNHWFDLHDDDVPRFGEFIYEDAGMLFSPQRRARYDKALAQLAALGG